MNTKNSRNPVLIIIGSVILVLVIAGVSFLLINSGKNPNQPTPSNSDQQTPSPAASFPANPENLETKAKLILTAWQNKDSAYLATVADPEQGVRFTPYTTVNPDNDLIFAAEEFPDFFTGTDKFTWGTTDGKGDPIELTPIDYYSQYIWNKDYSKPTQTVTDKFAVANNNTDNWKTVYPDAKMVTYYVKGVTHTNDWSSLSLVLRLQNNTYYLVGVIHSQWTI